MNSRVNIFTSIYPTIQEACFREGWAVGIHGSIARDFDLMLQPFGQRCAPISDVLRGIRNALKLDIPIVYAGKSSHNRCMFGINITEDMYLDISVIDDGTIGVEDIKGNMI